MGAWAWKKKKTVGNKKSFKTNPFLEEMFTSQLMVWIVLVLGFRLHQLARVKHPCKCLLFSMLLLFFCLAIVGSVLDGFFGVCISELLLIKKQMLSGGVYIARGPPM